MTSFSDTTASPKNQLFIDKAKVAKHTLKVAVVNPIGEEILKGLTAAAEQNLIEPILIGPTAKIQQIAEKISKDISKYKCIDVPEVMATATTAVNMAKNGEADAIMKGDIHTGDLMKMVVARESGLRTNRRISHCLVMDVPTYNKIMIFTDPAINIAPDLMTKKSMIENAVEFANALGIKTPKVALLAAEELVSTTNQAAIDAALLSQMARRDQIKNCEVDGPLAVDLAISDEAIEAKHFVPLLSDKPDIFVPPDLNSCNIAIKFLDYSANGQSAGIVLGAKVPIILMRRSSPAIEQIISCALAKIYFNYKLGRNVK